MPVTTGKEADSDEPELLDESDLVDDELLSVLKQAGCVELTLGVESGSPKILEMIKKDLDLDVVRSAVKLIRKNNISVGTFFMAGFPRETLEDMLMTFALIQELKSERIVFNVFDPMPGSELYEEAIELGVVPSDPDWCDFRLWPDTHFTTKMTPKEFDTMAWKVAEYVFRNNDGFVRKVRRHLPLLKRSPRAFLGKAFNSLLRFH